MAGWAPRRARTAHASACAGRVVVPRRVAAGVVKKSRALRAHSLRLYIYTRGLTMEARSGSSMVSLFALVLVVGTPERVAALDNGLALLPP
eukprot:COSAG03_NODE_631_length_6620_cov_2.507898_3_plen_91_part_00